MCLFTSRVDLHSRWVPEAQKQAIGRGQARRSSPRSFSCPGKANEDSTVEGEKNKHLSRLPPVLGECQTLPDGLKQEPRPEPGRALRSIPDTPPGLAIPEH